MRFVIPLLLLAATASLGQGLKITSLTANNGYSGAKDRDSGAALGVNSTSNKVVLWGIRTVTTVNADGAITVQVQNGTGDQWGRSVLINMVDYDPTVSGKKVDPGWQTPAGRNAGLNSLSGAVATDLPGGTGPAGYRAIAGDIFMGAIYHEGTSRGDIYMDMQLVDEKGLTAATRGDSSIRWEYLDEHGNPTGLTGSGPLSVNYDQWIRIYYDAGAYTASQSAHTVTQRYGPTAYVHGVYTDTLRANNWLQCSSNGGDWSDVSGSLYTSDHSGAWNTNTKLTQFTTSALNNYVDYSFAGMAGQTLRFQSVTNAEHRAFGADDELLGAVALWDNQTADLGAEFSVIPEPSSVFAMITGAGVFGVPAARQWLRRRRRDLEETEPQTC